MSDNQAKVDIENLEKRNKDGFSENEQQEKEIENIKQQIENLKQEIENLNWILKKRQQMQPQYQQGQQRQLQEKSQDIDKRNRIGCRNGTSCSDNNCHYNHEEWAQKECNKPDCYRTVKNEKNGNCHFHAIKRDKCEGCGKRSKIGNPIWTSNNDYKKCNNCSD